MKRLILAVCGVVVFCSLFVVCGVLYGQIREGARGWYRAHEERVLYRAIERLVGAETASLEGCRVALAVERNEKVFLLEKQAEIVRVLKEGEGTR